MIGPIGPVLMSRTSSVCEWYIHTIELPSMGPGPARSGTCHVYVNVVPGGTAFPVLPADGIPS